MKRITSGSPSRSHKSSTSASVNRRRTSRSVSRSTSIVRSSPSTGRSSRAGAHLAASLARLPLDVALYGVVGGVDLGGQPLGAGALLRVGEPVRVELLDELPALAVHLIHRYARREAETLVGGEHVRGVLQRGEGPRGGPSAGTGPRAPAPPAGGRARGGLRRGEGPRGGPPAGTVPGAPTPAAAGRRRASGTPALGAAA